MPKHQDQGYEMLPLADLGIRDQEMLTPRESPREFEVGKQLDGRSAPCRKSTRACAIASVVLLAGTVAVLAIRQREKLRRGNLEGVNGKNVEGALQCSFRDFPVEDTIQSAALAHGPSVYATYATTEEMTNIGVDMAGLWWMMGNKLAEEFVSWKGSKSSSPNVFPMTMKAPTNLQGNWVWPYSIAGRTLMSYYAATEQPSVEQVLSWTNSSYATIVPIVGGGNKEGAQFVLRRDMSEPSGDVWLRNNKATPDSPEEYIYTLVRVVNGDGTPNPTWWPKFLEYAKDLGIKRLYVWGTDNSCMRACEIAAFCWFCSWVCSR
jgi:hypothetical protein